MKQKHILKWLGISLGVYLLYGVLTAILVPLPQKEATGELWSQYEARLSEDASQERVRSIEDTDSALLWRLQLIESAEREVIFSTFDLRADGSGQDLMAALYGAAQRGVRVRVIVDGLNGFLHLQNSGVKGSGFEVLFSIAEQGPISLRRDGTEWLWRAPRPAFWRASTDNDRGCSFPQRASVWMGADVFVQRMGFTVQEKSEQRVRVQYRFGVPGVPGALVEMTYTVEAQGALQVEAVYHAVPGAPELPCFGVKFETTAPVVRTCWTGLSGETYPDRCKGGVFGCHAETPHIEPALVPQDCGLHMDTQQVCLQLANGKTLTIEQTGEAFAFSALPNTAQQIEAAQHLCELPETGRTSITVLGAARGVGGIDSWYR